MMVDVSRISFVATVLTIISLNSKSVLALPTELRGGQGNQTNELPTWFDPNTMRVVEKGDHLYLGYVTPADSRWLY
jgi:hypothetical protein